MKINVITKDPNFTVVLPSGCQADCEFCSWRTSEQDKQTVDNNKFLESLTDTLENLPANCTQLTISGGEPSTYKHLSQVLAIIAYHKNKNIKKVVFTTNGQNIDKWSKDDLFQSVVDFVNISRHDFLQTDNDRIMCIQSIDWKTIKKVANRLGKAGILTNINTVLSNKINEHYSMDFIETFIKIARKNSINSITFRKDYDDGFGMHDIEKEIQKTYTPLSIGECPVCRKSRYIMYGMEVLFTTSEFEPKDTLGESIYEFILQPNGTLTYDWEGNEIINLDNISSVTRNRKYDEMEELIREMSVMPKKLTQTELAAHSIRHAVDTNTITSCGGSMSSCG